MPENHHWERTGEEWVSSEQYGMHYARENRLIATPLSYLPDDFWGALPVGLISPDVRLEASVATLKAKTIEKVRSGAEQVRTHYVTRLFRDAAGKLYVVDGHYRVAMHRAMGIDMPARVLNQEKEWGGEPADRQACT